MVGPAPGEQFAARHRALADAMGRDRYDAVVVVGSGLLRHSRYLDWLLGTAPLTRTAYAVLDGVRPLTAVAGGAADAALLRAAAEAHGFALEARAVAEPIDEVAALLRAAGPRVRRVGIVGRDRMLDTGSWLRLCDGLPGMRLDDASDLVEWAVATKSAAEIEQVRDAARIAAAAYRCVLLEACHADARAADLVAVGHEAARRLGARDAVVIVGDGLFHGADPLPVLGRSGALRSLCVEVLGARGYWAEQAGMVAVGDLDPCRDRVARVALDALAAGERVIAPGGSASAVAAAVAETARRAGLEAGLSHGSVHGVGLGDTDLPHARGTGDDGAIRAGMTLALHPNVADPAVPVSATVGGTYVVREYGPERLSPVPALCVAGAEGLRMVDGG